MVWKWWWWWWHSWVYANVRMYIYMCVSVFGLACVCVFARVRRRTGEWAQSLVKSRVHRRRRDDFSFLGVPFGSFRHIHCSRLRHQQHHLRKLISVHLHCTNYTFEDWYYLYTYIYVKTQKVPEVLDVIVYIYTSVWTISLFRSELQSDWLGSSDFYRR